MWVRVLGSAAGGGFPQWNCGCPNCRGVREGAIPCRPRTQSSVAVSVDYRHWFILNAAPDIRGQIEAFPPLWPHADKVRHTPIQGVLLTDAELDHSLGLLSLREARSLRLYATSWVHTALTMGNRLLLTLEAFCRVEWQRIEPGEAVPLQHADGQDSGLRCEPFSTHSAKLPTFITGFPTGPQTTVGFRITDRRSGHVLVYAPSVHELGEEVMSHLRGCTCLLFDGTCWSDDELARLGIAGKTARAMGHLPVGDEDGSLVQLAALEIERRVYVHINNTNPLLIENSPERRVVEAYGIEVAADGMEMEV